MKLGSCVEDAADDMMSAANGLVICLRVVVIGLGGASPSEARASDETVVARVKSCVRGGHQALST